MSRPTPVDREIALDPTRSIISKTDTFGNITYANEYFSQVCGYSENELLGTPHNIVRHPDMPRVAFKLMWDTIKGGKNFRAIVKNLAKDGRYYWVVTDFEHRYDPMSGDIVGYTAVRNPASREAIALIEPIYKKLVEIEFEHGIEASGRFLNEFLAEKKLTYDEFVHTVTLEEPSKKGLLLRLKRLFHK